MRSRATTSPLPWRRYSLSRHDPPGLWLVALQGEGVIYRLGWFLRNRFYPAHGEGEKLPKSIITHVCKVTPP